ncbi:MAG: biotin--[acetyl-CoA-carboxylase] ligase [Pseudomonadota bacterium]
MTGWPEGVGRHVLEEIDSTNAEAARRAAAGEPAPCWILARRQTAGRGRMGRRWAMPDGNLAASLLIRPGCTPAEAARYSFLAALLVARLCDRLAPGATVSLKWPNDVLLNGAKVAGILLESGSAGQRVAWLALGIGVNLAHAPPSGAIREGGMAATSIAGEGGRAVAPEEALAHLAASFAELDALRAREGFAAIRRLWLARAARLGGPVTVHAADGAVNGVFEDVDLTGALVLRTSNGALRRIAAADIHFPD